MRQSAVSKCRENYFASSFFSSLLHLVQTFPSLAASTQQGCEQVSPAFCFLSQQLPATTLPFNFFSAFLSSAVAEPTTNANANAVIVNNLMSFIFDLWIDSPPQPLFPWRLSPGPDDRFETGYFYTQSNTLSIGVWLIQGDSSQFGKRDVSIDHSNGAHLIGTNDFGSVVT